MGKAEGPAESQWKSQKLPMPGAGQPKAAVLCLLEPGELTWNAADAQHHQVNLHRYHHQLPDWELVHLWQIPLHPQLTVTWATVGHHGKAHTGSKPPSDQGWCFSSFTPSSSLPGAAWQPRACAVLSRPFPRARYASAKPQPFGFQAHKPTSCPPEEQPTPRSSC